MTTLLELDEQASILEEFVRHDLSVKVDAMNWVLGQTYANTEQTRQEVSGIKVELAHLDTSVHTDMTALRKALDLRTSELRRELKSTEASIRHDLRKLSEDVDRRFGAVDQRFDKVDQRFHAMDQRFDTLEGKVDMILARIQADGASQPG